jgi:putative transcriptional regulator
MITLMIKPMLTELLAERGITLYKLAKDTDLAYSTLHKLSKAKTESIDFRVLDLICGVLDCEPGDVLKRVVNGERRTSTAKRRKVSQ